MLCGFCLESAVIETPDYLSSAALVPGGARSDYIASAAHYEAVARHIVAALRGGGRFVLVTGDPPVNSQALSEALGNVAGPGYAVIIISCGPELRREDLEPTVTTVAKPKGSSGSAAESLRPASATPLFVFDDFDRLSDKQIDDFCEVTLHCERMRPAGILLAPVHFLARLERPALHLLKERIAAQLRFKEVGADEAVAVLHNRLLFQRDQRDRRAEARAFRHGILVGLAAVGVLISASIGVFILHPTAEQVGEAPASSGQTRSVSEEVSMFRPANEAPMSAAPTSATATTPPPLAKVENPPAIAPSSVANPPAGPRLSATEITALLARGDAFFGAGDITSARLFYERAADAGSGLAAFQLWTTFDPVFQGRAGIAEAIQVWSWYRRASELGVGEDAQRVKALETRPLGDPNTRSR
jgi:hypothetical protein